MNGYYFGQKTRAIGLRVYFQMGLTVGGMPNPGVRDDDGARRGDEIVLGRGYYVVHYPIGDGPMLGVVAEDGTIIWRSTEDVACPS